MFKRVVLAALLFLMVPLISSAYDVEQVTNGGTITGTVLFTGHPLPKNPMMRTTSSQDYCGQTMTMMNYLIKDGKVQNVVVFIKNIKAGASAPKTPAFVDNYKCAFVPHVGIGFKGNSLNVKNSDPVFHNIHTYLNNSTYFNVGLSTKGMQITRPLKDAGLIEVTCDAHPWMEGWLYVFDNPYAALTNANGQFVIKNVPPGIYTVEAWHEKMGRIDLGNVKVTGGETTSIKLSYKKAKGHF